MENVKNKLIEAASVYRKDKEVGATTSTVYNLAHSHRLLIGTSCRIRRNQPDSASLSGTRRNRVKSTI